MQENKFIKGEDQTYSDDFYREIFEKSSAAMALFNSDATIVLVNEAFCTAIGYSKDELLGTKWFDKLPPEELERIKEFNRRRVSGDPDVPKQYEAKYIKGDNKIHTALFSVSTMESNKKIILTFIDIKKRKEAEQKLRLSEERFRAMVEYANDIVYTLSEEGIFTYVSPNWVSILGYNVNEIIGYSFASFVHPDNHPLLRRILLESYKSKRKYTDIEYQVKDRKGNWRWHISNTSPVINAEGKVDALVGITRDITDRKLMEEALAESEFFFKESQRAGRIGSYKFNIEEETWEASDVLYEIFGIDKNYEKTVDPGWTDIIHPDDREYIHDYLRHEVIGKQLPFSKEYRIIRKSDNELRWVNGLGEISFDKNGKAQYIIGTIQDITKRKISEQIISDNHIKLNMALKIAHLGAWEYSTKEDLFYFNDTFYAIFKTSVKEVGKDTMSPLEYNKRFVHPDDQDIIVQEIENAGKLKDTNYTRQFEHRIVYANGGMGYITVRYAVVKDSKGRTVKTFGINQDVTSAVEAENRLKESEADLLELNSMKDKFFSIIAHDLKNPFSTILGMSELLLLNARKKDYAKVETFSNYILQSAQKAMDLLTNLLEWSRAETGRIEFNPQYISLLSIIKTSSELLLPTAEQKNIAIEIDVPEELNVFADISMINTILRNLISNAIKFTFPGGKITVSAAEDEKEVLIKVADTGKGISENMIKKLFRIDENTSTEGTQNEQGTGLGLILCKEFIEKHEGCIRVESEEGKGSKFYVSLKKSFK